MNKFTLDEVLTKINDVISSVKKSVPANIEIRIDEQELKYNIDQIGEESILVEVYVSVPEKDYTYIDIVSSKLLDEIGEFTVDSVGYNKDELYDDTGVIRFSLDKGTLLDYEDPFDLDWDEEDDF
jgi:hypothetical protein